MEVKLLLDRETWCQLFSKPPLKHLLKQDLQLTLSTNQLEALQISSSVWRKVCLCVGWFYSDIWKLETVPSKKERVKELYTDSSNRPIVPSTCLFLETVIHQLCSFWWTTVFCYSCVWLSELCVMCWLTDLITYRQH